MTLGLMYVLQWCWTLWFIWRGFLGMLLMWATGTAIFLGNDFWCCFCIRLYWVVIDRQILDFPDAQPRTSPYKGGGWLFTLACASRRVRGDYGP